MAGNRVQDEVALHRRTVARLRGEIGRIDRSARSAYIRAFHREFRSAAAPSSFDDLVIACYRADLVYIGDFHALPRSQTFTARLLDEIARRSRRAVLAVEMVYGRSQQVLDRWMAGEIGDEEFLRRIRYEQDWGYDWGAFRAVFDVARRLGLRVFGIDAAPRTGMRFIRERDRYMASRIADVFAAQPEAKVVVMVGESHLATSHLPVAVRDALAERNMERASVRVLQNLEEVYWEIAARGEQQTEVVEVGRNVYGVFNATPLEKYEAYRHTLDRWGHDQPGDADLDLTPTIHNMIDTILKFLGVNKYRPGPGSGGDGAGPIVDAYPEVYSPAESKSLSRLLRENRYTTRDIAEISYHMRRNGSCYIPGVNAIFIGAFNLVHGGEEAAHFVNYALRGDASTRHPGPRIAADHFYGAVIAEALGFFGSKIIDPSRNHFFETEFYRYYRKSREVIERETPFTYEEFRRIIDFILLHKKFERAYHAADEVPTDLLKGVWTQDRRLFSILTHELGYFLGQQIYDGHRSGAITRAEIVALFRRRLQDRGEALGLYLDLIERLPGGIEPAR